MCSPAYSVWTRPLTPHGKRLNPLLRALVGPMLRAEAQRLSTLYITGAGYRRALSAFVHQRRGVAATFLWEVRDFIDRMPGDTVPEVLDNVIAGL
jgi:hypothetical protein